MSLSAHVVAEIFSAKVGKDISIAQISGLLEAGLFVSDSSGKRFDTSDVVSKLDTHTHLMDDISLLGDDVFRISVIPWSESKEVFIIDDDRREQLLAVSHGVNYDVEKMEPIDVELAGLASDIRLNGDLVEELVARGATVVFTCKGYVARRHVRRLVGWSKMAGSTKRFLHTEPIESEFLDQYPNGFWINVPAGRATNLDYSSHVELPEF